MSSNLCVYVTVMYLNMYLNNAVQISSICDCDWYWYALYDF